MSKRKKYITIAAVLVVGIIASMSCLMRQLRISLANRDIAMIVGFIKSYIKENAGCFPASEADLEKKAGLYKTVSDSGVRYFYLSKTDNDEYKYSLNHFELFKLRYGARSVSENLA